MKVMLSLLLISSAMFAMQNPFSVALTKNMLTERLQEVVYAGSLQDFEDHKEFVNLCGYETIAALQESFREATNALRRVREHYKDYSSSRKEAIIICDSPLSVYVALEQKRLTEINRVLSERAIVLLLNKK